MAKGHGSAFHCAKCCGKIGGSGGFTAFVILICAAAIFGSKLTYILIGIAVFVFVLILAAILIAARQFTRRDDYRVILAWDTMANRPMVRRAENRPKELMPVVIRIDNQGQIIAPPKELMNGRAGKGGQN